MKSKIKVAAVSYLNTKPLLYGLMHSIIHKDIDLVLDYPANLAQLMQTGNIDIALLPVAAITDIPEATICSDYGIASDGNVASVALFSRVPLAKIETVLLDYQSRTSVRLAQLLLDKYHKKSVKYKPADTNFIDEINNTVAGVIIGDRALKNLNNFEYVYDLSKEWKDYTGHDFVFAAWVTNKVLPTGFQQMFNEANAFGLYNLDAVLIENPFPYYDLFTYYTENIKFYLDDAKKQGLQHFLDLISNT